MKIFPREDNENIVRYYHTRQWTLEGRPPVFLSEHPYLFHHKKVAGKVVGKKIKWRWPIPFYLGGEATFLYEHDPRLSEAISPYTWLRIGVDDGVFLRGDIWQFMYHIVEELEYDAIQTDQLLGEVF